MKSRCNNSNDSSYKYYGAKGIKVCKEWSYFKDFKEWAFKNNYQEGLTIDRINPIGNYEPDNCRWITSTENITRMNHSRKGRHDFKKNVTIEQVKQIIYLLETTDLKYADIGKLTNTNMARVKRINNCEQFTELHNYKNKIRNTN